MKIFAYPHAFSELACTNESYLTRLENCGCKNEKNNYLGMLLFTSLRDKHDPWELANFVVMKSVRQIPVVAVHPYWEHPVLFARKILSFQHIHQRAISINWITGISQKDLSKLGVNISKSERYSFLAEYIEIVNLLLSKKSPINFSGKYFKFEAQSLALEVLFEVKQFLSGSSTCAVNCVKNFPYLIHLDAAREDTSSYSNTVQGVGLGIVVRPTVDEARKVYELKLPKTTSSKVYSKMVSQNSDSRWRKMLSQNEITGPMIGSDSLQRASNLGFFVGDYDQFEIFTKKHLEHGIKYFFMSILDSEEHSHLSQALNNFSQAPKM